MSHLQLNIGCPIYERPGIPHDRHSVATRTTYPMAVFSCPAQDSILSLVFIWNKDNNKKTKKSKEAF